MPRATFAFALSLAVSLAACGGDSPTDPGGTDGNNNGGNTGRTVKADPSFASDVFEIFTRRGCTGSLCHGGGQGGLTMSSATGAYADLVDVKSPITQEVRVIAGNAANSYLVKKLEGTASAGERMPLGGSPLDATDLQNIKNWINQGAKNN
jgi:hypothetical protein